MKTIGIKLADGSFYPVLQEGTREEKQLDLTTAHNNQTRVMVDMYRSRNCTIEDAEYVDTLQIDNLIAHPNGEANISFTVCLDEDNNLFAKIVDSETGAQSKTTITLVSRTLEERLVPDSYAIKETPADEENKKTSPKKTGGLLAAAMKLNRKDENPEPLSDDADVHEHENKNEDEIQVIEEDPTIFDTMEETAVNEDETENSDDDTSDNSDDTENIESSENSEKNEDAFVPVNDGGDNSVPSEPPVSADESNEGNGLNPLENEIETENETEIDFNSENEDEVLEEMKDDSPEENSGDVLDPESGLESDDFNIDDLNFDDLETETFHDADIRKNDDENSEEADLFDGGENLTIEGLDSSLLEDSFQEDDLQFDGTDEPITDVEYKIESERDEQENSKENSKEYSLEENEIQSGENPVQLQDTEDETLEDFDFDGIPPLPANDDDIGTDESIFNTDDMDDFNDTESLSSMGSNLIAADPFNFEGLYDEENPETENDETETEENEVKEKTRIPVIICIVCAIICVIATALVLFIIPSKYNLFGKNGAGKTAATDPFETENINVNPGDDQSGEIPEDEYEGYDPSLFDIPDEELDSYLNSKERDSEEQINIEAKEDEVVIIEEAEKVVPAVPEPVLEKPADISYKIKWGDTLWDISDTYYKNPWKYKKIAAYNGIKNPDYIISGTVIAIPSE